MGSCPKCGEEEVVRCRACCLSWECDACGATSEDDHEHQRAVFEKLIQSQKEQLAAMTARAEKAEALAAAWEDTAAQIQRNSEFWRNLVVEIGDMLGPDTRVDDAGETHDDVLALRVSEVLVDTLARSEKAEAEVVRLREAIEARDGFARDIGYPATCTYCGRRDSTHHTDCPTITHPVEVEP